MRSRSSALVLCAGLVLLAGSCSPEGNGTEQDLQDRLAAWEPQFASCDTVEAYLDQYGQDFTVFADPQTAGVRIHLDAEGQLTATPKNVAISRGDTLHFRSDTLRWKMRWVADASPVSGAVVNMSVAGVAARQDTGQVPSSIGPGQVLSMIVADDAECGRYHYVVGAYHPGEDEVHVLDPPIIVRD